MAFMAHIARYEMRIRTETLVQSVSRPKWTTYKTASACRSMTCGPVLSTEVSTIVRPSKTRFGEDWKGHTGGNGISSTSPSATSVGPVESAVLEATTATTSATGNRKPASVSPHILLLLLLFILLRGRANKNDIPDPKLLPNPIDQSPETY